MVARYSLLVLCLVWWLVPSKSLGQEAVSPIEQAKAHYETAKQAFAAGQYAIAKVEFEAALGLLPPDGTVQTAEVISATLFNLALVAERLHDFDACRTYIAQYRKSTKEPENDEDLKQLEARLPATNIAPLPLPPPVASGSNIAPPPLPPPVASGSSKRGAIAKAIVGPAVLLALGGATLLSSVIPATLGGQLSQTVEAMPVTPSQLADFNAEGTRLNTTAISLSVVGGALVIGGVAWIAAVYGKQHRTP